MTDTSIDELLKTYPRSRPLLSSAHETIYVEEYKLNRGGQGLLYNTTQRLESWLHRMVARQAGNGTILELGAGSLNHVPYEAPDVLYDCVEPFLALYENSPHQSRIRNLYQDINDVSENARYDRILSIAVLEHLENLPSIVARSGLLLNDNGVFQGSIPTESGLLWGLSWRLTTGVAYRLRTGLDYATVMRHEHINNAREITAVLEYFFSKVKVWRFPTPLFHVSFYTYLEAISPRHDRCIRYLKSVD